MRCALTDKPAAELNAIDPETLRGMAAAVGVSLSDDRAATLAPQAGQHFAQLRHLDAIANPSSEPAAQLRLDHWTRPASD
jgi:hypothetical protein